MGIFKYSLEFSDIDECLEFMSELGLTQKPLFQYKCRISPIISECTSGVNVWSLAASYCGSLKRVFVMIYQE